jgi:hypothetical protein
MIVVSLGCVGEILLCRAERGGSGVRIRTFLVVVAALSVSAFVLSRI